MNSRYYLKIIGSIIVTLLLSHCSISSTHTESDQPVTSLSVNKTSRILREHTITASGNAVAVRPEALYEESSPNKTRSPSYNQGRMTLIEFQKQLDDVFAALDANSQSDTVLIFIHGGLNSLQASAAHAVKQHDAMPKNFHPIFLNWDTGLVKSYGHHLLYDRAGVSHDETGNENLTKLMIPFVLLGDLGAGISKAPQNLIMSFAKDCQNVEQFYDCDPDRFPTKMSYHKKLRYIMPDQVGTEDKFQKSALHHTGGVSGRMISVSLGADNTSLGVRKLGKFITSLPVKVSTAGLLEGAGTPAWDNMVRRSRSVFRPSRDFVTSGTNGRRMKEDGYSYAAFREFFIRFTKWTRQNPNKKVMLVGHSMGTIVLNEMFRQFDDIRADDIRFLAAACSINDFLDSTAQYLKAHKNAQFHNLCLHPRSEIDEDHWVVRGSLLVWIDQYFEGPRHFLSRTLGSFENAILAYDSLPQQSNIHLGAFPHDPNGQGGKSSQSKLGPQVHGAFSHYNFWDDSFLADPKPN